MELMIGLLVLVLVGGASAAVAMAVSRGWQHGENTATSSIVISRTMHRIQDKMQRARFTGQWRAGSVSSTSGAGAAVLIWRGDDNGDGKMQLEETQLLEHDPAKRELLICEASFPDAVTRAAMNGPFPTSMLTAPNAIDEYKDLLHKKTYAINKDVRGAAFNVITPANGSQRQTFEYTLKFRGVNGDVLEYGTATSRWSAP